MEKGCSFFGFGRISCGEARGVNEVWNLVDCVDNISGHLISCNLSKSELSESQLILARAGLFDVTQDQQQPMLICASHRFKLGRYWRPLRSCQYPAHEGRVRNCKSRHAFNVQLSKEVQKLYGQTIYIGSRKYIVLVIKEEQNQIKYVANSLNNNFNIYYCRRIPHCS